MRKFSISLLLLLWFVIPAGTVLAQADTLTAVKVGSNYFIQCQTLMQVREERVLYFSEGQDGPRGVNFNVYSESGTMLATVRDAHLTTDKPERWDLSVSDTRFTLTDKLTGRILMHITKAYDDERQWNVLSVWADLYVPMGFYFQCTPEECSVPEMKYYNNTTFRNVQIGIFLE